MAEPIRACSALSVGAPMAPQLGVDTWTAVASPGGGVDGGDLLGQLGVADLPRRGDVLLSLVTGGTGDLEQLAAVLDAMTCDFLRLDEGVHLHR